MPEIKPLKPGDTWASVLDEDIADLVEEARKDTAALSEAWGNVLAGSMSFDDITPLQQRYRSTIQSLNQSREIHALVQSASK